MFSVGFGLCVWVRGRRWFPARTGSEACHGMLVPPGAGCVAVSTGDLALSVYRGGTSTGYSTVDTVVLGRLNRVERLCIAGLTA